MSLALDVGLFFRNSKTKLGLTLSARAIIFTLAFRVGTRSSTWVSPDSLAEECGIQRQNIFEPLNKIVATGMVQKKQSTRHKQKKTYSFSDLIKNYHQKCDSEKIKIHEAFGDEYKPPVDKFKNQSGKPDSRNKNQSGKPDSHQSGKPDWKSEEKIAASPVVIDENDGRDFPKEKAHNNTINQNNRATASSVNLCTYPDDFFPDEIRRLLLTQISKRTNSSEFELLTKFEEVSKRYKTKASDWQAKFQEFLFQEMPKKVYEDKFGQKRRYDNQTTY